jgi:hypothetical protein
VIVRHVIPANAGTPFFRFALHATRATAFDGVTRCVQARK